jgi:hypothetical protein
VINTVTAGGGLRVKWRREGGSTGWRVVVIVVVAVISMVMMLVMAILNATGLESGTGD